MSAYGMYFLLKTRRLTAWADRIAAMSIDAFDCRIDPFDALSHQIRPHTGQLETAQIIHAYLEGSEMIAGGENRPRIPIHFVAFHRYMVQVKTGLHISALFLKLKSILLPTIQMFFLMKIELFLPETFMGSHLH